MKRPTGKFAWSATVGAKGQIVIPKEARDMFGIEPGDTLILFADQKRGIAIPPKGSFDGLLKTIFPSEEDET